MQKLIKLYLKEIKILRKLNKSENEINLYKIKIYSLILGYFDETNRNMKSYGYDYSEFINNLKEKIDKLIYNENSQQDNEDIKEKQEIFNDSYEWGTWYYNKCNNCSNSVMNVFLLNEHVRNQKKLLKLNYKTDILI